ncbi:MAG: nucleotidyltransferase domain-containing protein [Tildeniella nuda ZEHNDER 1965/U140]|jgi:predicted nucleotidyltransferase|nr:nucleotidyltransferase domain-containing protein [Tildeniella nuda ZEHNDER 1965/U140]
MAHITPEQMAVYQASHHARKEQKQQQLLLRQQHGLQVAHQAAQLLKEKFGATRIVLFGSLLDLNRLHPQSDIDLAAWGLHEQDYLHAVSQLLDLSDFSIDLIEAEYAPPKLLKSIQDTGREL